MSWGASLMRLPEGMTIAEMAEQFGNDWKVPPVGTSAEIHAGLRSLFPASDHRDGATNYAEGFARVQFTYSDRKEAGVVDSIGVTSNGDIDAIPVIKAVCDHFGLKMVDHQNGEVADFSEATERSMADYAAFRDRNLPPSE